MNDSSSSSNNEGVSRLSILAVTLDPELKHDLEAIYLAQGVKKYRILDSAERAKQLIKSEQIDVFLIDADLPNSSGLSLAAELAEKQCSVVLIANLESIAGLTDTGDVATQVLMKPAHPDELLSSITEAGRKASDSDKSDSEADYCKVNISDFISGKNALFDIYIRLSKNKFLKFAHKGENPSLSRLQALKSKNTRFLYIKKSDFKIYVGYNIQIANTVAQNKAIPKAKKIAFIKHVGEIVAENIFVDGANETLLKDATTFVTSATAIAIESSDAYDMLISLEQHSEYLFAHSVAVSLFSLMIAKKMGWESPQILFKVGLSGLMHDVGKKEIPREILEKARGDRSAEETKIYETHCVKGSQILSQVSAFPTELLQVILQHHENLLGQGYPLGLKKDAIHPIAKLVAVSNTFCNLVLPRDQSNAMKAHTALDRIISTSDGFLDPGFLIALMNIFEYELPTKYRIFYQRDARSAPVRKKAA